MSAYATLSALFEKIIFHVPETKEIKFVLLVYMGKLVKVQVTS